MKNYLLTASIVKTNRGDETVGIDRSIPSKHELPLPFLVETSPSPGYKDISSISNWKQFALDGNRIKRDYIFVRQRIKDLVINKALATANKEISDLTSILDLESHRRYLVANSATGELATKRGLIAEWDGENWKYLDPEYLGYDLCSASEREIAMQLYIGDPDVHDREWGAHVAQEWRDEYHELSIPVREKRIERAETLIETQLGPYQSVIMLLITSLVTPLDLGFGSMQFSIDLHKNYWRFGVLGTVENRHPLTNPNGSIGIMDYIYGRDLFAGRGLIDMPWQPKTLTLPEVCDRINEILVEGIY